MFQGTTLPLAYSEEIISKLSNFQNLFAYWENIPFYLKSLAGRAKNTNWSNVWKDGRNYLYIKKDKQYENAGEAKMWHKPGRKQENKFERVGNYHPRANEWRF